MKKQKKVKIKFIKDTPLWKLGSIEEFKEDEARVIIEEGDAEYYNESVDVKEKPSTPILPSTPYYIQSWGYYNKNLNIIIEQITPKHYIFNYKGKKGIVDVQVEEIKKNYARKYFEIEGMKFIFENSIMEANDFYHIPALWKCEEFIKGKYKPRSYLDISKDIKHILGEMFEFNNKKDIETSNLFIAQTWLKPKLNEFFFYGIDASKGGGKTTLGEIVFYLCRHGFMGGDITSAVIPRLVTQLDLNIFIDELDQNQNDEVIMSVLRKGQRRKNPYVRCEGRDNRPVVYDIAGCHGFSFRSEVEDAFIDRAVRVHTAKSRDYRLPIINANKPEILENLADELFFWFIDNIISVEGCSRVEGCRSISKTLAYPKKIPNNSQNFDRNFFYDKFTNEFNQEEKDYLKSVFGRDNELSFLCLKIGKILSLNILMDVKNMMEKRTQDSESSENFYLETLKDFIVLNELVFFAEKLKDGGKAGYSFFPKSKLYMSFVEYLNKQRVSTIGTKRYNSLLRDIGFMEGITITSQRHNKSSPAACLIFDETIKKSLGIEPLKAPTEKINDTCYKCQKEIQGKPINYIGHMWCSGCYNQTIKNNAYEFGGVETL